MANSRFTAKNIIWGLAILSAGTIGKLVTERQIINNPKIDKTTLLTLNSMCPMTIDSNVRWDSVSSNAKNVLTYHHTLTKSNTKELNEFADIKLMREELRKDICSESTVVYNFDHGIKYVYNYYGNDNLLFTSFTYGIEDCKP